MRVRGSDAANKSDHWQRRLTQSWSTKMTFSPHADQIAGDQPTQPFAVRHDVAPEVRGSWIAVLENDCITAAVLDVGHPVAVDGGECLLPVRLFGDRHRGSR